MTSSEGVTLATPLVRSKPGVTGGLWSIGRASGMLASRNPWAQVDAGDSLARDGSESDSSGWSDHIPTANAESYMNSLVRLT